MSIDAESLDHEQRVEDLLEGILMELKRLNVQHQLITNEIIEDYDIEDKR